jgi:3-methyladenine DNA glycosylase AlkD
MRDYKMQPQPEPQDPKAIAAEIDTQIRALPKQNTPNVRAVRRRCSQRLQTASPGFMLSLAREWLAHYRHRWVAYELIRYHEGAFASLDAADLEALGRGMDSWWSVDAFARLLSGPVWLNGGISDEVIHRWARSEDRWWRRAALVSTVALNTRSHGGYGDVPRTLAVCRMLVDDHDDMLVKALSWALRALVPHDPDAVREFLDANDDVLAARVKREVRNKLTTGLKTPRRGAEHII